MPFGRYLSTLNLTDSNSHINSIGLRASVSSSGGRSPQSQHRSSILHLSGCKHFHYDSVDLGPVFVESNGKKWHISKTFAELCEFDCQLHRCVFDRRHSRLIELATFLVDSLVSEASTSSTLSTAKIRTGISIATLRRDLVVYANRLTQLTGSVIKCFPVLKFLELDHHGNRFIPIEQTQINTPAIGAAIVVKDFAAVGSNELSIKTGDIVSIIEMQKASGTETETFWKGKLTITHKHESISMDGSLTDRFTAPPAEEGKNGWSNAFEVGYFPSSCVQLFTDKSETTNKPDHLLIKKEKLLLWKQLTKPRSGDKCHRNRRSLKLTSILNSILFSNSPNKLFGTDLSEHTSASGLEVPLILNCCIDVIETHGVVTGIYRQCGIESNIRRLRWEFENGTDPKKLIEREFLCDIHCISSLFKQYFRQLPNPLFTYEIYAKLMKAYECDSTKRIYALREAVRQLPSSHFKAAGILIKHLCKMSKFKNVTDMNASNLAIAPNIIRCPPKNGDEISNVSKADFEEEAFLYHRKDNGIVNGMCIELNTESEIPVAFHTIIQRDEIKKAHPDSFSSWRNFISLPMQKSSGSFYRRNRALMKAVFEKLRRDYHLVSLKVKTRKVDIEKEIMIVNETNAIPLSNSLNLEEKDAEHFELVADNPQKVETDNENGQKEREIKKNVRVRIRNAVDKSSTESLLVSRYDNVLMSGDNNSITSLRPEGKMFTTSKNPHRPVSTPI
uniref:Rho-GAP domain-containing protein n=1 Tax=Ditylenchus dipsaci TaxID=166011 RepID=A0A915EIB6_9BILA